MPLQQTGIRQGINRRTGKLIEGWDHTAQSIEVILTTRLNTRVMRLEFGSNLLDLIDKPQLREIIALAYSYIAGPLERWEPNFELRSLEITRAGPDGQMMLDIDGLEYPRGHLGDFTVTSERVISIPLLGFT